MSIVGAARVEIKGTQNLKLIPEILKDEMRRQRIHMSINEELKSRGVSFVESSIYDVTSIFKETDEQHEIEDSEGVVRTTSHWIQPVCTLLADKQFNAVAKI